MKRTQSRRQFSMAIACVTVLFAPPRSASAANLWIAYDPALARFRPSVEDFFDCMLGASGFNTLAGDYRGGRTLAFGGSAALTTACSVPTPGGTRAYGTILDCIERQTLWPVATNDVVLYYVNQHGCNGFNASGIRVHANGTTVTVRAGFMYDGGYTSAVALRCMTTAGQHEALEATTDGVSGDCCNGQYWVPGRTGAGCCIQGEPANAAHPNMVCRSVAPYTWRAHPYGWMNYTCGDAAHGGVQNFEGTYYTPAAHEWDAARCAPLTVDDSDVCAWRRSYRQRGVCTGGNLETCVVGRHVQDCHGLGCSDTPMPHCNEPAFGARCMFEYPDAMCSGATADVSMSCVNTGTTTWNAGMELTLDAASSASAFHDATWVSSTVVASMTPAVGSTFPLAPGATGEFHFRVDAPSSVAPLTQTQVFALRAGGDGGVLGSPPADELTMTVAVAPCHGDGGFDPSDANDDIDPNNEPQEDASLLDGDAARGPGTTPAGCGCRTARPVGSGAGGLVALGLAFVAARRKTRKR